MRTLPSSLELKQKPLPIAEIDQHWFEVFPHEAVGLILDDGTTIPLKNRSADPVNSFVASTLEVLWKLGWGAYRRGEGINMIYHTHDKNSIPSETDAGFMALLHQHWPHVSHLIYVPGFEYSIWHHDDNGISDRPRA